MVQTRNILIAATVFATLTCTAVQATAATLSKRHASVNRNLVGGADADVPGDVDGVDVGGDLGDSGD
tara:strand:+ start:109 stop:309 length:201 start_codon:yes stop_codon:yes gene_type:complete